MRESRKLIRRRLKDCTRTEYFAFVNDANLSIVQRAVLDFFIIDRLPVSEIAFRLSYCESLVRLRLSEAYDKIAKSLAFH